MNIFKFYAFLLTSIVAFIVLIVITYGLSYGFVFFVVPLLLISLYFKNIWFCMVIAILWIVVFDTANSLWLVPFILILTTKNIKYNFIAFTITICFALFRYIFSHRLNNEAIIMLITYVGVYIFALQGKNIIVFNTRNKTKTKTIQIKIIDLTEIDLYILTERYVNKKTDKTCLKQGSSNEYYDNAHVIRVRRKVLDYNNLQDTYELATILRNNAFNIISKYK
jgi:hypothetical protein